MGLSEVSATHVADDPEPWLPGGLWVVIIMARTVGFSGYFVGSRQGFYFAVLKSTELLEVNPEMSVFAGQDLSLL